MMTTSVLYLRCPPALVRQIKAQAKDAGMSVNAWVTLMCALKVACLKYVHNRCPHE